MTERGEEDLAPGAGGAYASDGGGASADGCGGVGGSGGGGGSGGSGRKVRRRGSLSSRDWLEGCCAPARKGTCTVWFVFLII